MANVVKLKRSAVSGKSPTISDLQLGEVALNTADGNLFFKKDASGNQSIVEVLTTDGSQTVSNKTLSTTTISGDLTPETAGTVNLGTSTYTFSEFHLTDLMQLNDLRIEYDNSTNVLTLTDGTSSDVLSMTVDHTADIVTTSGTQTLSNKTISDDLSVGGDLTVTGSLILDTNAQNIDLSSGAGIIDDQGVDGSSGQILTSTGQGVRWTTNSSGNLSGLGDVTLSGLTSGQIIKYNGTVWVNADENTVVTSAVFAANATSDLGPLSDENISAIEDLEPEHETEDQPNGLGDTDAYYNMGSLAIDGVVGLRNVDQSLKSDYISYSIIFGF
jgi:hypothetical protein